MQDIMAIICLLAYHETQLVTQGSVDSGEEATSAVIDDWERQTDK